MLTGMTDHQYQAMEDVDRFGDPHVRVRDRQAGAWAGVVRVLRTKREWIAFDLSARTWVLTRKGVAALRVERRLRDVRAA